MEAEVLIPESVVRDIVRLIGQIVELQTTRAMQRRALMMGLARMIDADAWAWMISRAADSNNNPAIAHFQHEGYDETQIATYVRMMQDRQNTPVEYAALNQLRRTKSHFTRRWDQLVSHDEWYGPNNRQLMDLMGFEHVMYSVRVLDDDGLFSGISLKRKAGRENFTPVQQRIAHIVTSEIDWLHQDENLDSLTRTVRPLTPSQRTVLTLLMEGHSKPQIAAKLGCSYNTVKEHVKALYAHFNVHSSAELFHRFMAGDGNDME